LKAYLVLEDKSVYCGTGVGAEGISTGEVVYFNCSTGYQELLTDPASSGKLFVMTFPLVGNYGVNAEDIERKTVFSGGLIMRECCDTPSNFRCQGTLREYMKKNNIVGIEGLDTRALTSHLRDNGSMKGAIISGDDVTAERAFEVLSNYTACGAFIKLKGTLCDIPKANNPKYNIAVIDYGVKASLINTLAAAGCETAVFPCSTPPNEVLSVKPDGIVLAGGTEQECYCGMTDIVKGLLGSRLPILGVGLGHSIIAKQHGFKTIKHKTGHHGIQPVKDTKTGRVISTYQNHIKVIDSGSVNEDIAVKSHINIHDNSLEGLRYKNSPILTLQFDPVGLEGGYLIEEFLGYIKNKGAEG
jgi:carbamoyl-phosphate synthase small subunit